MEEEDREDPEVEALAVVAVVEMVPKEPAEHLSEGEHQPPFRSNHRQRAAQL